MYHGGWGMCIVYIAISSELLKTSLKEEAEGFLRLRKKKTKSVCLGCLKFARFPRTPLQGYRSGEQLLEDAD